MKPKTIALATIFLALALIPLALAISEWSEYYILYLDPDPPTISFVDPTPANLNIIKYSNNYYQM